MKAMGHLCVGGFRIVEEASFVDGKVGLFRVIYKG
jgi:hypothetical protein